jgi:hypothetical protein
MKRILIVIVGVGALAAVVALASTPRPAAAPAATGEGTILVSVDREIPESAAVMLGGSDLVVLGRLTGTTREYAQSSDGRFHHLAAEFEIVRVFRGEPSTKVVEVSRSEGPKGERVSEEGAEAMADHRLYVLFLERGPIVFATVGGPIGQFDASTGRLDSMAGSRASDGFDGLTLDELAERISVLSQ